MSDLQPSLFSRLWLTEVVRLREAHWGPLDDARAVRDTHQGPGELDTRIMMRAHALGQADHLAERLTQWRGAALAVLALLAVIAIVSGGLAASGALGDGTRPVNVIWALGALLGLHALTFIVWMFGLLWSGSGRPSGLGAIWLWATRKLARGPQAGLAPTAFINLLAQARARTAFFGMVSHGLWALALAAALITLIALLSTAQYRFIWATTLLEPDRFVSMARTLGAVPGWLGFGMPDAAAVRASDGRTVLGADVQTQWSLWLLGVCLVYGLLPRVVAFTVCAWRVRRALAALRLDTSLPGYVSLRDRLLPSAQTLGIDRPVEPLQMPQVGHAAPLPDTAGRTVVASLEISPDVVWPPAGLDDAVIDAGAIDDRQQRSRLLDRLAQAPAARLLLVCDARRTPDRGSMNVIADLARYATLMRVALYVPSQAGATTTRVSTWIEHLKATGLKPEDIVEHVPSGIEWVGGTASS